MVLQAQVAFLQGERRGQENLKKDLVRRIKMLEFVLKQERWVFITPTAPNTNQSRGPAPKTTVITWGFYPQGQASQAEVWDRTEPGGNGPSELRLR